MNWHGGRHLVAARNNNRSLRSPLLKISCFGSSGSGLNEPLSSASIRGTDSCGIAMDSYINSRALYGNRKSKFEPLFLAINDSKTFLVFLCSQPRRLCDSTMSGKKIGTTITTETLSHLPEGSRPKLVKSSTEASESLTISATPPPSQLSCDIEHVPVKNDPRAWSPLRKVGWSFLSRFGQLIRFMLERQSSAHRISRDDCFTGC
jgi:hypothetical protein